MCSRWAAWGWSPAWTATMPASRWHHATPMGAWCASSCRLPRLRSAGLGSMTLFRSWNPSAISSMVSLSWAVRTMPHTTWVLDHVWARIWIIGSTCYRSSRISALLSSPAIWMAVIYKKGEKLLCKGSRDTTSTFTLYYLKHLYSDKTWQNWTLHELLSFQIFHIFSWWKWSSVLLGG